MSSVPPNGRPPTLLYSAALRQLDVAYSVIRNANYHRLFSVCL